MRFHVIFAKTLHDLLSLKRTAALVVIGVLFTGIMSAVWSQGMSRPMSLQMQTHYLVDNFTLLAFMWIAGLFLAISVAATAAGFISKEDTEGTLLIMVSKPISRVDFVMGKFLALVANAMLIQTIVLLLSVVILWIVLPIDPQTFDAVFSLVPWMLLYSLLVTLAFGSIAVALSALMKSRVKITMVAMLLIMVVFLVGIVPRTTFSGAYESFYLYYLDGGYHLGNTFTMLLDQAAAGQMMPQNQPFMTVFAGTYKGMQESFDPDIGALPPSLELTNYVSPVMSTAIWLTISAVAMGLAVWAVQRKEVH